MKIVCSACLLGENCKYNGGNNYNDRVANYVKGHDVVTVCPEVMGGLPTPRVPSEIRNGIVTNREGTCVDNEFRRGAQVALDITMKENADLVILQSRSPSCGCKQIYDGSFSKKLIDGKGVYAQLLAEHGFRMMDAEDVPELSPEIQEV